MAFLAFARAAAILVCAAAFTLSAPAGAQGHFRLAILGEPDTIDPQVHDTSYAQLIIRQLFTSLVETAPDGSLAPGLAERWEVSDDGLQYTFHIARGRLWTDGTPIAAEEIARSFIRQVAPETLSPIAPVFYSVKGAAAFNTGKGPAAGVAFRASGVDTLVVELESPDPFLPRLMTQFWPVPMHAIAAGRDWLSPAEFVGSGDYRLTDYIPQIRADMVKAETAPALDPAAPARATIFIVTDETSAIRRFQAGEVDAVTPMWGLGYERVPDSIKDRRHTFNSGVTQYIALNQKRPALKDARARRALDLVLDRTLIADRVIGGGNTPAFSIVPRPWADIAERPHTDDIALPMAERRAKAKALLAEAGFTTSAPLAFELIYSGETRKRIAIALQGLWQEIGVDLAITEREVTGMYAALEGGDYDAALPNFSMGLIKDPLYLLTGFEPGGFFDFDRPANPAFTAAIAATRAEADPVLRAQLAAKAEAVLAAEVHVLPLFNEPNRWLIAPQITGWDARAQPTRVSAFRMAAP